ncbi:FecR [Alcanivorax xiamenensis]|uniref:FecR n=1 Tax=Alcanivorax xiamenensis TaxID=1177156 RepID=A0ABQ6Y711_9GAMM|nr:FecR domain-containing protein [Alcanivorax xiamenensis]KAF0805230.1 FecR [Alcanivorax xiamenensis]
MTHERTLPESVVHTAIQWQLRLDGTDDRQAAWQDILEWCEHHPDHALAWQRLCSLRGEFRSLLETLPDRDMALPVLNNAGADLHRRRALKSLLALLVGTPGGWLAYRYSPLHADYRTGAGEQQRLTLEDGTRIQLNTRSSLDVRYSDNERRLVLNHGEMWVESGADAGYALPRPLRVEHRFGHCETKRARFLLRDHQGDFATLWVEQGEVTAITATGQQQRCAPGEHWRLGDFAATPLATPTQPPTAWTSGMLVVDDMRLEEFVAELARYRSGHTGCDPAVADLRLSGVFQLDHPDALMEDLGRLLPVEVVWRTSWWVRVMARA